MEKRKQVSYKEPAFPKPKEYSDYLKEKNIKFNRESYREELVPPVFWRGEVRERFAKPIPCAYCSGGKYIPSIHIDRCPQCLFKKHHRSS